MRDVPAPGRDAGVPSMRTVFGGDTRIRANGSGSEGNIDGDTDSDLLLALSSSSSSSSSSSTRCSSSSGSPEDQLVDDGSTNDGADCIFPYLLC
jgi:U3 small nucleolar RNA-associated protein 14